MPGVCTPNRVGGVAAVFRHLLPSVPACGARLLPVLHYKATPTAAARACSRLSSAALDIHIRLL